MAVISEQEMVGCTSNRIFRTSDGGYTWIEEDYEKASLYPKFRSIAIAGNKGYITEKYGTLLEYSPTTGIKEFSSTNQNLLVYPNPVISGSEVNFKLDREIPGEVNFEILDINGNTIDKNTLTALPENKACSFDTSDLSSGTYFIKITSAKDSWSSKFSVVR